MFICGDISDTNFPMLLNNGLSMSLSKVNACGVVLPHLHPRAAQIYYIIKGQFKFGFVQENGAHYVEQIIEEGQGTIFPQGSIHYFINTGCEEVSLVAVASSDDPGRIDVTDALFNVLPGSIVSATLGGQKSRIDGSQIQAVDPAKGTTTMSVNIKTESFLFVLKTKKMCRTHVPI